MGERYEVRKAVYRRSHALFCTYCGCRLCQTCRTNSRRNCPDTATWDHIIPLSLDKTVSQVVGRGKVVACDWCNHDRMDRKIWDWFQDLRRRLEENRIHEPGLTKARNIIHALDNRSSHPIFVQTEEGVGVSFT